SHRLMFKICKSSDGGSNWETVLEDLPPNASEIRIVVDKPVERGVFVYAPDPEDTVAGEQQRCSYVKYCLDVEGPNINNRFVPTKPGALWPRFYIYDALFSAFGISTEFFDLVSGNGRREIGQVATAIAADIFLHTDEPGSIKLFADDET